MNDQELPPAQDRTAASARMYARVHRYRNLLRKRWWILPLAVLLALCVQGFLIWRTPPSHVSVGRMIVNVRLSIPEGSLYTEEFSNFLGTQVALMQSGAVQNRAAARLQSLKPELLPAPVRLHVTVSPRTSIFNLRAESEEPLYAQAFLDACMEEYIALKREMRSQTSEATLSGITDEVLRLERELRKGEDELVAFQTANSVVFLQEQGNSAGNYLVALNRQLAGLKTEFQLLKMLSLEQNLERQQKDGFLVSGNGKEGRTIPSELLGSESDYLKARQQIQLLRADQQELSQYLRPKHPKMTVLSEEIARREKLLEIFRQQSLDQLANRRGSLELQIQNLEREIKEWEAQSLDVSKKMAEYQKIKANTQRIQSLYDRLLATMQSLDVNKEISPESVTVMERASAAVLDRAAVPKQITLAALIGLMGGIGLLMLIDRFDDRMATFTELEELFNEPLLGQIPREKSARRHESSQLLQTNDERHAFSESYRNLRSSLLFMSVSGHRPRVLLVTSSIPDDGKSMTVSNLAITMAQAGSRVLLIDADLRKGVLHRNFDLQAGPGLSEVLAAGQDWQQAVQPTAYQNLSLLPRGAAIHQASEWFLKPVTAEFIKTVSAAYDYVIFDSAPVMAADDVTSLAPLVDGVIFVVRSNQTSARVARAALELLYQRQVQVLGLVFNAVDAQTGEYYYYKYKDYYTAYPSA